MTRPYGYRFVGRGIYKKHPSQYAKMPAGFMAWDKLGAKMLIMTTAQ